MARKTKICWAAVVISIVLIIGSAGAVEFGSIPMWIGAWQTIWAVTLGLLAFYIIALDEYRAAHMVTRRSHI